jgi:hypothetical protein
MRILLVFLATSLVTGVVEAQTVGAHPSARYMPLRVFDATGKLVGGTVGEPDPVQPLAVTLLYSEPGSSGDAFTLKVKAPPTDGQVTYVWAQLPSDTFFFETGNCTGQAYVESPGPMPGRRLAILDWQTNVLYLSEPNPTVAAKTYHSLRRPQEPCDVEGPQSFLAVAVDPIVDMDEVFALPFEIR